MKEKVEEEMIEWDAEDSRRIKLNKMADDARNEAWRLLNDERSVSGRNASVSPEVDNRSRTLGAFDQQPELVKMGWRNLVLTIGKMALADAEETNEPMEPAPRSIETCAIAPCGEALDAWTNLGEDVPAGMRLVSGRMEKWDKDYCIVRGVYVEES